MGCSCWGPMSCVFFLVFWGVGMTYGFFSHAFSVQYFGKCLKKLKKNMWMWIFFFHTWKKFGLANEASTSCTCLQKYRIDNLFFFKLGFPTKSAREDGFASLDNLVATAGLGYWMISRGPISHSPRHYTHDIETKLKFLSVLGKKHNIITLYMVLVRICSCLSSARQSPSEISIEI